MPIDPHEFAQMLGAEIVGEVPEVGAGPFGMARLARILQQRLTPSQGERPGRPTDPSWVIRPKVPMSKATAHKLADIAEAMTTPQRRVSPMQVAAQLLEEAVRRLPGDLASPAAAKAPPQGGIRVGGQGNEVGPEVTADLPNAARKAEDQAAPEETGSGPDPRTMPQDQVGKIKPKATRKPRQPGPKAAGRRKHA